MAMDLGKQIGPLPLGAWMAVVAGGLGIALWTKQNKEAEEPEIVEDTSGVPGVGEGVGWIAVPPPSGGPATPSYDTNEAWSVAAINWLVAQGYDAGLANSAITKALMGGVDIEGNKMTVQEWALWSLALVKFGAPPQPVNVQPPPNPPVTPPTNPPPTEPPPSTGDGIPPYTVYISKSGDTLTSIGKKYGKSWREIYDFNLKYRSPATAAVIRLRGPNLFFAGTRWWIPK